MSTVFHDCGTRASQNELFMMVIIGHARISAFSCKSQLGKPSGPSDFVGINAACSLKTDSSVSSES